MGDEDMTVKEYRAVDPSAMAGHGRGASFLDAALRSAGSSMVPNFLTWDTTRPEVIDQSGVIGQPAARNAPAVHVLQVFGK